MELWDDDEVEGGLACKSGENSKIVEDACEILAFSRMYD